MNLAASWIERASAADVIVPKEPFVLQPPPDAVQGAATPVPPLIVFAAALKPVFGMP